MALINISEKPESRANCLKLNLSQRTGCSLRTENAVGALMAGEERDRVALRNTGLSLDFFFFF